MGFRALVDQLLKTEYNHVQQLVNIFWFRRDLRLDDNAGLYHALRSGTPVVPVFIFDSNILDDIADKKDARITFIYQALEDIQARLKKMHSSLEVYCGFPEEIFKRLFSKYKIKKVFTNHDYEPYAILRDQAIEKLLKKSGVALQAYKDQVIFDKNEVLKDDGKPYTIFTPYCKQWKRLQKEFDLKSYPVEKYFEKFHKQPEVGLPSYNAIGFRRSEALFPPRQWTAGILSGYDKNRNFPAMDGTSKMSVHLRFGTVSIRKLVSTALSRSESFVNELIWRDFYHMILWHFPRVGMGRSFKPQYDFIKWRNNEIEFDKWCKGLTGHPIVDAGMRQLNETGFMHNRVRMIVASFLAKHLLIDWRWGEEYFAKKIIGF